MRCQKLKLAVTYIGDIFVGALAYTDDLILTAPSANALWKMLAICDAYASEYFMNFNAQESKCMIVLPSSRRVLAPLLRKSAFKIGGKRMEIVFLLSSWAYYM